MSLLLTRLREEGLCLTGERGHLRCCAPKGRLTDDLLAFLRQHKDELLSALLREKMEAQGEEAFYEWEERAAILEFEAGLPRLEAERRAAHLTDPPAT